MAGSLVLPRSRWENMGQAKICVKCPTEAELYDIQGKAQAAGLVNYLVVSLLLFSSFARLHRSQFWVNLLP